MFQTEKVTWYLVSAPEVGTISGLNGNTAVGTVGDTQETLITLLVERDGLAGRDITRVAMPSRSTMTSILALKSGAIQAAALNGDEALLAEKENCLDRSGS